MFILHSPWGLSLEGSPTTSCWISASFFSLDCREKCCSAPSALFARKGSLDNGLTGIPDTSSIREGGRERGKGGRERGGREREREQGKNAVIKPSE